MGSLYQKALEIKNQKNHTVVDIRIIVQSAIKNLNTQYRTGQNKKKVQDSYISEEYKTFIAYLKNDNKEIQRLLNECIIDETRIANFVKGETKRPHNRTKDFFAVYCGFEGYNDFVANNKNINEIETKKESIIPNTKKLNLSFIAEHPVIRTETLLDAFEAGLNYFFIEEFDKEPSNKEISFKSTFPVLFKSLNLDGVFSFDTFDFILKRLKINKLDLSKDPIFEDNQLETLFVIGINLASRIFNLVAIQIYGDSKSLQDNRIEIDDRILSILSWLDMESVYLSTIENFNSSEPDRLLKFISEFKGIIRKKFAKEKEYTDQISDFLAKVYMFGFETKIDEIINFNGRNRFEEVDAFLTEIQENHSRDNISYFTELENTKDIEEIKQKIACSFLKDYYKLGELIALDLIGCNVFSTRAFYESEEEFKQNTSLRKMAEIENLTKSLNLLDIYDLYMPKLYYDDKRCKLDGNYNVFLVKVLKRIKSLD